MKVQSKHICCGFRDNDLRYRPQIVPCLRQPASYTVEAAYLVPMILFLLVLIGTAALYLHDRCVACFDAEAITICGRMLLIGNSDGEDMQLESFVLEEGTRGLLMTTTAGADGTIGTRKITSSVDGTIGNAFAQLFKSWGWPLFSGFSAVDEDWTADPCTLIRDLRILQGNDGDD